LYWGTYNFVFANHNTAVQRIRSRRLDGGPANLRHHRFDGTGTIAVQLQRTATTPPRTPALVADPAGRYRNVLVLPWNGGQWILLKYHGPPSNSHQLAGNGAC
jgi:hypothetical protein